MRNIKAFTLVELIVVVTILAILSTIGFVSYSGYLAGVRDTNRIAQLKAIGDALHLYSTNKSLPTPDDKIDIKTNTKIISYQGYVGKDVIETVGYTAEGLDPKDKTYFSYYLTKDKKYFQLMAFLEEEQGLTFKIKLNNQTQAEIDYETRYPRVEGSKLGILTGTGGAPLQELITTGEIDLVTESIGVTSILSNSETQTGITLASIASDSSCKRLYEVGGKRISGLYNIDPEGNGTGFKVYCDMETEGGGWTKVNDDLIGTELFVNTSSIKTTLNNGLQIEVSIDPEDANCGAEKSHILFMNDKINWSKIMYTQDFLSSTACWGIMGDYWYIGNNHSTNNTIKKYDNSIDKVFGEIKMNNSSNDSFDGLTRRCDNEPDNFWHTLNGYGLRSMTSILRRGDFTSPTGLYTEVNCSNSSTKWIYKDIYIR